MDALHARLSERQLQDRIEAWKGIRAEEAQAKGALRAQELADAEWRIPPGVVIGHLVVLAFGFMSGCAFWAFVVPILRSLFS